MCQYPYFVCPIEYSEALGRITMDCEPSSLFRPQEYTLPETLFGVLQVVSVYMFNLKMYSLGAFFVFLYMIHESYYLHTGSFILTRL